MKTICIKTNNESSIDYLLNQLKNIKEAGFCVSFHKFKVFNNIFIHFDENKIFFVLTELANVLSTLIIKNYEPLIEKRIFLREYIYFDKLEQKEILEKINKEILNNEYYSNRRSILYNIFYQFLSKNNKLFLKGFITFRLEKYINELSAQIDTIVNSYILEKEYEEFISLLNLYVNSEQSKIDSVHLIYKNKEPILLDNHNNPIKCDINLTNAKYLSDISFSSADVVFNTLLNIIPQKIYIHLNNKEKDEFINTLELIFENRVRYF